MFNPGFFGKSPPRWFIGQIPLGQTVNYDDGNGWGDRVKVRIVGYHPSEGSKLEDKDLGWAVILRSTSHGSLNRMSTAISGGEWVIGVFMNNSIEKPLPLILGVLGRSDPSYQITGSEVESRKSSEFKRTLNWYSNIKPQVYHVESKDSPSKTPSVPSKEEFEI